MKWGWCSYELRLPLSDSNRLTAVCPQPVRLLDEKEAKRQMRRKIIPIVVHTTNLQVLRAVQAMIMPPRIYKLVWNNK